MNDFKRFALGYEARGFSVIPLVPNSKQPLMAFADREFTREDIEEIWTKTPDANIGLRTRDFFVIDIDIHGNKNGFNTLKNWKHLKSIPLTSQVNTASGGKHLYLKKPVGFNLPQKVDFMEGVDIKSNPNNYIVAPPSVFKGNVYSWDMKKSPANLAFTEATQELINNIEEEAGIKDEYKQSRGALKMFKSDSPRVSKVTLAVNECLKGLGGEGARNNKVASYVGSLISCGIEREVVEILVDVMNNHSPKPLKPSELKNTIQSMYSTHKRYNK